MTSRSLTSGAGSSGERPGNRADRSVAARRSATCSTVGVREIRNVDAGWAPCDAATAADAPGGTELVDPRGELVCHPLPVARLRRTSDRPAVEVGVLGVEAGVPHP